MPSSRLLGLYLLVLAIGAGCGKQKETAEAPPAATPADALVAAAPSPADAATPAVADAATAPAEPDAAVAATDPEEPKEKPDPNTGPMKDLQVLSKKMSRKEVEAYMKKDVAQALGVKCGFCHVKDDFAAPHKHKTVAREMMKMTNDIAKSFFKGKQRVTCMTCHQGKAEP